MQIAVLAYHGISPFMMSSPLAVFGETFIAGGHHIEVCAADRRFHTTGGLAVETTRTLQDARDADIVILPGWRDADEPIPPEMLSVLRSSERRGAIVVGLCLGAFGLAEAGLLDGRRATTHWARAQTFAQRYPRVTVDAGALFVDEGQVVTSAGVASGLDCCLHLLARISGVKEANRVARQLVVAPQRSARQPQLIDRPALGSATDSRLNELLEFLRANPATKLDLGEMAKQVGMSRRSFTRNVRQRTGGSLGDWLRQIRVVRAQELLADGVRGLEQIADRSGFPDASALRTAFRSEFGLTPRQWMARLRSD